MLKMIFLVEGLIFALVLFSYVSAYESRDFQLNPQSQTAVHGLAKVIACTNHNDTRVFTLILTSPNGTVAYQIAQRPNTANNFTFSNGIWCKSYVLSITQTGTWHVQVEFFAKTQSGIATAEIYSGVSC